MNNLKIFYICLMVLLITGISGPAWGQRGLLEQVKDLQEEAGTLNKQATQLCQSDNHIKAIPLVKRIVEINEKVYGSHHPETVASLKSLVLLYDGIGASQKAIPFAQRVMEIENIDIGGEVFKKRQESKVTRTLGLLDLIKVKLDEDSTLGVEVTKLAGVEKYTEAIPLARRIVDIRVEVLGQNDPDTEKGRNMQTLLQKSAGMSEGAALSAQNSMKGEKKVEANQPPRVEGNPVGEEGSLEEVQALNERVVELYKAGRYQEAIPLAERALKILENVAGLEHPVVAESLTLLATGYKEMGFYLKAITLVERALEINEKDPGPEHYDTSTKLMHLAMLYKAIGFYDKAITLYERALKIMDNVVGPEPQDIATILNKLAMLYFAKGSYWEALPLLERALKIREKYPGPEHPDTATSLNNLAFLYQTMGFYDKALPFYERALKITENVDGPKHLDTANSLNNLAFLYQTMGFYDKGLHLFERALIITENEVGPEHPDTARSLNNLGGQYYTMGFYSKALPLLERALKIMEKTIGPEDDKTKRTLANLGLLYLARKDYMRAEDFCRRGNNEPCLADISLATGKAKEALNLLTELRPSEKDPPSYRIQYYTQQGQALALSNRRDEAAEAFHAAIKEIEELRGRIPKEVERSGFFQAGGFGSYLRAYRGLVATLATSAAKAEKLPTVLDPYGPTPGAAAFYFAEATKARSLLEAMAEAARKRTPTNIQEELRKKEEDITNQLGAIQGQWEKAYKGEDKEAIAEVKNRKERLTRELRELVKQLREKHPAYAAFNYPQPVPAANLPLREDEVLIEYALGSDSSYVFVVRKGGLAKLLEIPMGREALEEKVKGFLAPMMDSRQGQGFSTAEGQALFKLLLAEALPGVKESDELVIVPDGILGLLPFETLVMEERGGVGQGLYVGDRYRLRYYQSAAVLALERSIKEEQAGRPLFALGNPIFSPEDPRYVAFKKGEKPPVLMAKADITRGGFQTLATRREWGKTTSKDEEGKELQYLPLPESAREVEAIAGLFGVKAEPPDVLLDFAANETRFLQAPLADYQYLHFATHGDLPGKVQGINEPFLLLGQVENNAGDDGFLTLSEVMGLKLRARLVVLSACVTGHGKMMEGEGVVNFARAFQHAGARSVLVSLWPVASDQAVEYMKLLYGHLQEGKPRAEALRLTRQAIKAKYPNPFFWAPFILHGEG